MVPRSQDPAGAEARCGQPAGHMVPAPRRSQSGPCLPGAGGLGGCPAGWLSSRVREIIKVVPRSQDPAAPKAWCGQPAGHMVPAPGRSQSGPCLPGAGEVLVNGHAQQAGRTAGSWEIMKWSPAPRSRLVLKLGVASLLSMSREQPQTLGDEPFISSPVGWQHATRATTCAFGGLTMLLCNNTPASGSGGPFHDLPEGGYC
ncbi:uncharacterized protein PGRI_060140 [Penicillium griseofulvum]|uniref:Uncharacterized protein n=1 Tax=Penicillium patulum TaxID=5078 RepID=A0A135LM53_PENPA|nr:uncharacterized protein PGRI_060140 [Penicillium griseofulvum]KXG50047.1 hypothetical protein PGRI_060140 [Penicillium griseofulvum]